MLLWKIVFCVCFFKHLLLPLWYCLFSFSEACSWRPDSTRCYPGSCSTELSSSCTCSSGFGGIHCQNSKLVVIRHHIMQALCARQKIESRRGGDWRWTSQSSIHAVTYTHMHNQHCQEHKGTQIRSVERKDSHGRPDQAGINEKNRF